MMRRFLNEQDADGNFVRETLRRQIFDDAPGEDHPFTPRNSKEKSEARREQRTNAADTRTSREFDMLFNNDMLTRGIYSVVDINSKMSC